MTPYIMYLLGLAQRAGNTPAGQRFLAMAQQAADKIRAVETKWPTMARGPGGAFPARTAADKIPVAPIGRGLAGAAGVGSVAAGSGQFEGVRNRLFEGADASPAIPSSLWGQLDQRSAGAPPMPPEPAPVMNYGSGDSPRETAAVSNLPPPSTMPPAARAAVTTARSIVAPQAREAPMPPVRPQELRTGAPMTLPSSPDYQSNMRPVRESNGVNWGDPDNAADFFRAERAMRGGYADGGAPDPMGGLMPPDMSTMPVDAPLPMPADAAAPAPMEAPKAPSGGGSGGKDAAINKALDIIHKLIIRQGIA